MAPAVDFAPLREAAWIGLPNFTRPVFRWDVALLFAPAALVLVAENLGHIKAVGAMTGQSLDRHLGRAFVGDGLACMVAASGGGTGVTTYAENIGVMAVTRIYSTLIFVVAGVAAVVMGMSPKFGALVGTIPGPVLGGLSVVLFGLIAATGGRIWVQNRVDFSSSRNLVTAAVTLTIGAGDLALKIGGFTLPGIGTATFGAIILYQLLREPGERHDALATADSGVDLDSVPSAAAH
jgi:putative pyrimidine permease RutG